MLKVNLKDLVLTLTYLLTFLTPVIFSRGTNELFEFPKMIFVYTVTLTIIFVFALGKLWGKREPGEKIKLNLPVAAFLLANLVSTVFSSNLYTSIFGYYTRFNGGLLSILAFTALFTVLSNVLGEDDWEKVKASVVISSIPVSIYAVAQHLGFEKGFWVEDSSARVFSTLGQPNWLAAYIIMTIFISIHNYLKEPVAQKAGFFYFVSLINFSALWFTYSLSGFLGLLAGTVFYVLKSGGGLLTKRSAFLALSFLLVCLLRPGPTSSRLRDTFNDIRENISAGVLAYASENAGENGGAAFGDTTAIRLVVWEGTVKLMTSSPKILILGTGPETFPYVFPKFRPERLNLTSEWDFIFNKPHNYYLEVLSNLGLTGFISYLLLITKALKHGSSQIELTSSLFGLFVTDAFGWHTVSTSLLFYLYLALVFATKGTKSHE